MSQTTPPPPPPSYPPQFTDPKSAKAQAKAEKAYQKASRPFYKKKRFMLLAVIVLIVIIAVISTHGGGGDKASSSSSSASGGDSSSGSAAKAVGLNQAARDGKFEFTVKGVDCSKTSLGDSTFGTKAQGVFCLVSVHVSNIGNEAQTLDATSQYGYDAAGKKYSTDTEAEIYLGDQANTLFNQLNPGSSVDGILVYDVPAGTKLTKIELHDSMFSGGVDVNLG